MEKPIPAFYCCYLLRSTVRHQSLYVGSTPNPVRRLRQHNGQSRGGAARTSRERLRPWEMACIVTGFPSRLAALQFEWSWQNPHLTRHIPTEDRITATRTAVRVDPSTGRTKKRPARPQLSLTDRLANLHLLLRVRSFERWPLRVTFFAEDVYRVWDTWIKTTPFRLRNGICVELEKPKVHDVLRRPGGDGDTLDDQETIGNGKGIDGIDIGYESLKAHLEKSRTLLEQGKKLACAVCNKRMQQENSILLVCPEEGCNTVSHMTCLSEYFLEKERKPNSIVPLQGHCPGCKKTIHWTALMRELSLRIRGENEVAKLFKKRKQRTASPARMAAEATAARQALGNEASSDEESEHPDFNEEMPPSPTTRSTRRYDSDEFEDVDEWYNRRDETDIDMGMGSERDVPEEKAHTTVQPAAKNGKLTPIVIEDSDWDDAESLA